MRIYNTLAEELRRDARRRLLTSIERGTRRPDAQPRHPIALRQG